MSSLKFVAVVAMGAAIGAFIAVAVVMPQVAGATAANVGKLILTQWLGLGTTTPSQRLSVAGSAYITGDVITGSSIKFPDGTTQTTAASAATVYSGTLCGMCSSVASRSCGGYNVCSGYCPSGYSWLIVSSDYSGYNVYSCVKN